jgi:glycosyltransferase involved in cell wall biosynthesis
MKYPFILFYRDDEYSYIDEFIKHSQTELQCTIHITNKIDKLNKIYNSNYNLLIFFEVCPIDYTSEKMKNTQLFPRILYIDKIDSIESFNALVNTHYINVCALPRKETRPVFSLFTTTYNSFDKILRAFNSIKKQTLTDWEWIIIDDSPDDEHFNFLRNNVCSDNRVRLYRRSENSSYIGNVKNESVALCRGEYVIEMDHDDEILPFVLEESAELFSKNSEVGFIYMDFINIFENGDNFFYGDNICKGYGSYYCQKYNNRWAYVYNTPNINNITLSHLVCCPNHPRIWRKNVLLDIGNYCEFLPICDDYEILLRTAVNTKIAKIHKFGYIQYMNNENSNFSLIRNGEINRIGPQFISPIFYEKFQINSLMKKLDAYEDEKYLRFDKNIWKRDTTTYTHKFCNLLVNYSYTKQYCIIGVDSLIKNMDYIKELYKNETYDFLVLDNKCTQEYLWSKLDTFGFDRMKCYSLIDIEDDLLVNYFKVMYLSNDNFEIITANIKKPKYNSTLNAIYMIINSLTNKTDNYLEIGVEYGHTLTKTHFINKKGIDPDPKYKDIENIYKGLSDDYFNNSPDNKEIKITENFDVILIDGMHQTEYVLNDFNNSIKVLNKDGHLFLNNILPINYKEQQKIPDKHYYENGILKYGEPWTGDVWKIMYHLLLHYKDKITFTYYYSVYIRGLAHIKINEPIEIPYESIVAINNYNYFEDFNNYIELLEYK